uniref:Uncharacterized protein n=1 Tax=Lepeophtheirus salmonis TaxID=72036 RepID=A0A0K2UZH5_LEPSM
MNSNRHQIALLKFFSHPYFQNFFICQYSNTQNHYTENKVSKPSNNQKVLCLLRITLSQEL